MGKARELQQEFLSVFSGAGSRLLDSIVPLLIFFGGNPLVGARPAAGILNIGTRLGLETNLH